MNKQVLRKVVFYRRDYLLFRYIFNGQSLRKYLPHVRTVLLKTEISRSNRCKIDSNEFGPFNRYILSLQTECW